MAPKPYLAPIFFPPNPVHDPDVVVRPLAGYYQVREYTCGFASTLMVLHAFHRRAHPQDVYQRLGTDHTGTRQTAIVRTLRHHGVGVNLRYDLGLDDLCQAIDDRKLVIAYHHNLEHWVVVYGYGRNPERIFVADPYWGTRSEHLWTHYGEKLNGFGMICSPRAGTRKARESARQRAIAS